MSLVFITHDLAVLSQIATHGVVLEDGRVVEEAPVSQLLTRPASRRDAGTAARCHRDALASGRCRDDRPGTRRTAVETRSSARAA